MSSNNRLVRDAKTPDYTVREKATASNGFAHQSMISGVNVVPDSSSTGINEYLLHESGGEGITVFVMDMGFDVENGNVREELRFQPSSIQDLDHQKSNHFIVPISTFLGTDVPSSILHDRHHGSHLRDTLSTDIHAANAQRDQGTRVDERRLPSVDMNTMSNAAHEFGLDGLDTSHGHGTQLASLAIGTTYGIAPKAKLYPVKVGSCLWNTNPTHSSSLGSSSTHTRPGEGHVNGEWQHHLEPVRYQPWAAAFAHIIKVIRDHNLQGKAVALCSTGHERARLQGWKVHKDVSGRDEQVERDAGSDALERKWTRTFQKRIEDLADLGVPFVCSAGNNGHAEDKSTRHIGDLVPGCLADDTSCRTPICVGAVDMFGKVCGDTSLEGSWDGEYDDARVTLWGMGEGVRCMGFGGVVGEVDGTSYSAAIVAGLVTYILGHPCSLKDPALQWNNDPDRGFVILNRLRHILSTLAYQRLPQDKHDALVNWNTQGGNRELKDLVVNVAYNGARGTQNDI